MIDFPVSGDKRLKPFRVATLEMATCKAIRQEGAAKGTQCKFPASENGYCGRHQRVRLYDEGVTNGSKWCRFFFRGCNATLTAEDISANQVSCKDCRASLVKKKFSCNHDGCNFKVTEDGFCKKHERDKYYTEEREKGIKYCDIARGCFNLCVDGKATCETCLEQNRIIDNKRYEERKQVTLVAQASGSEITTRVCVMCGKDFEKYLTRYNKESLKCKHCSAIQHKQDTKRADRVRNYKIENKINTQAYFKEYIKSAAKRSLEMTLDFNAFSTLVSSSCYYCNYYVESEVNGIDRLDNTKGYTTENCVTACWDCNRMKHVYHPDFFLEKCKIIAKKENSSPAFFKKWDCYYFRTNHHNYTAYKREAEEKRNITVQISQQQWDWLVHSPCYLCGYQTAKGIGIDRVDNTIRTYTLENSRPCCGSCNTMKGEMPLPDFLEKCETISTKWLTSTPFKEIPTTPNPFKDIGHDAPIENRKHWKAPGLYYAILSNSATDFQDTYSDVYTQAEFNILVSELHQLKKEDAIIKLQKLLQALKQRKKRAASAKIS